MPGGQLLDPADINLAAASRRDPFQRQLERCSKTGVYASLKLVPHAHERCPTSFHLLCSLDYAEFDLSGSTEQCGGPLPSSCRLTRVVEIVYPV